MEAVEELLGIGSSKTAEAGPPSVATPDRDAREGSDDSAK